jgi:predicted N-acyltransferase
MIVWGGLTEFFNDWTLAEDIARNPVRYLPRLLTITPSPTATPTATPTPNATQSYIEAAAGSAFSPDATVTLRER